MWAQVVLMVLAVLVVVAAQDSFHTKPPPISPDFSCSGRPAGFYADVGTNCRAYHMCDDHGNHFTHYCPEDTAFRQDASICDHSYKVDCQANIDSSPVQTNIGQDDSHDAPPSSFVETLHGEGTNVRGFARSFRINPEAKSSSGSKYPTFVLNSSVFLTDRESNGKHTDSSVRSYEPENVASATTVTKKDYSHNPFLAAHSRETSSENFITTTHRTTISEELQPPAETPKPTNNQNNYHEDDFSFLVPPPVRDDNNNFRKDSFETSSIENSHFGQHSSGAFSSESESKEFGTNSFESVTFSPRTQLILDMMKARSLGRESNSVLPKPVKFLQPPIFSSDSSSTSRSTFNYHNDDFPYVETLRSIQNNKASTRSSSQVTPRTRASEPSILAVPSKPLTSADVIENDPYYPKTQATTEAYYTPRHQDEKPRKPHFTTTRRPHTSGARFEIPAVLPDLNSLEDLLDRRKFFFIPQIKSS